MDNQLSIHMRSGANTAIDQAVTGKDLAEHITILTAELEAISQELDTISQQLPERNA